VQVDALASTITLLGVLSMGLFVGFIVVGLCSQRQALP